MAGYQRAMQEAGLPIADHFMLHSSFDYDAGLHNAKILLADEHRAPTAIFAANDAMAEGVIAQAREMGFTVPQDLSVVGYSDTPCADRRPLPMTTVRVPFDQIASAALDMLTADDQARKPQGAERKEFLPTLIPRSSTDRPRN